MGGLTDKVLSKGSAGNVGCQLIPEDYSKSPGVPERGEREATTLEVVVMQPFRGFWGYWGSSSETLGNRRQGREGANSGPAEAVDSRVSLSGEKRSRQTDPE